MRGMKRVRRAEAFGVLLSLCTLGVALVPLAPAYAATQTQSYNLTINSQVVGPPPTTPPTIDSPTNGTTFDTKQAEVKGSCITSLIVKVYRNNLFAGSALCDTSGQYSVVIDLIEGRNDLVARQYDAANQTSPDSDTVTVYYIPPTPVVPREDQPTAPSTTTPSSEPPTESTQQNETPTSTGGQLIISYDYTLQAIFPGQSLQLPIQFTGGTPPYAISISWGDGKSDLFIRENASDFTTNHAYEKPGFYTVVIKITDKNGQQATMQFVLIVNGSTTEAFINQALTSNEPTYVALRIAGAAAIVLSWAGAFAAGGAFQFHKFRIVRRK